MNKTQPNILLITCDQLRADCLGCYGNSIIRTPNIDRIADQGTRFEHMHVASPVCAPNRGSIATGRWPSVHGLRANGYKLPESELTLMECLRRAGYATFGAGKMHFAPQWEYGLDEAELLLKEGGSEQRAVNPQPRPWEFPFFGFEDGMFSEDNRVGPYADYVRAHGLDPWADPHSFTYPQHSTTQSAWPESHHQTTWVADRSLEFLEKTTPDRPFFLWTSFVHPHHPFNPPAPFDTMYDPDLLPDPIWDADESVHWPVSLISKYEATAGGHEAIGMSNLTNADFRRVKAYYYGMISLIDKQVGRLLDMLERRHMAESTIVVFTSDHGELLGDHHLLFKGSHFDCVTRVPFILSGSGRTGNTCPTLCQSPDIMPTLLDMAGLVAPDTVQGRSLRPAMENPVDDRHEEAFIEDVGCGMYTVLDREARLTWHGPGKRGELYAFDTDPNELCNSWGSSTTSGLQQHMMERLLFHLADNFDPIHRKLTLC